MEQKIIIIPSERMDNNKKADRNEQTLLRLSKSARDNIQLPEEPIEVVGNNKSTVLTPFQAFSHDLLNARVVFAEHAIDEDNLRRTCFVSSKVFKLLGGNGAFHEALITDTFAKLLIGTDPELLLMQNDKVVSALNVFGNAKEAKFGSDGAMAELRPDPAYTTEQLVENIRNIFNNNHLTHPAEDYDWMSSCYHDEPNRDYPVGMHIHIDNPPTIAKLGQAARERLFAVTNKILDELLTVPLIRLDGDKGHNRRAKCRYSVHNGYNNQTYGKGYGFFGEWRDSKGHLEHRSLSGLVLANPELCTAVFGTARAIAEATYKAAVREKLDREFILPEKFDQKGIYNKNFKSWGEIPLAEHMNCVASSKEISDLMDKSSRQEIGPAYIKKWLDRMQGLETYKTYAENIESLGELLKSSPKVLDGISTNLKQNWKG